MGAEVSWDPSATGVLRLPSGRLVRGRGLRSSVPEGLEPNFGVYLQGDGSPAVDWPSRWVRWLDWRLPGDREDAEAAFREAWERGPQPNASRWLAPAAGDGLAPLWPVWRSSTALHPDTPSPMSGSTTTPTPSRLPGNAAASSTSTRS